ncbi:MAG: four helix bundle protein [Phycisphaeraceae bacterium]|nr:four helix bundle protein [Phycisphaeraceae bacterium]
MEDSYRQLEVWQRSMDMAEMIYTLTEQLPDSERYGLVSQLRRAVVSIPSNIAEGYGRSHRGDYLRHLSVARGSLMEVETQLTLSVRLKLLERDATIPVWEMTQRVGQMLTKLIQSLS